MNLIEQLGGYKKASEDFKKLHLNLKEQQKSNKVFMDAFDALKTELLEYRREHNIFEVGDIVIVNGHESVYQIQYVYESACGYGMYQGRRFSHSMIERHATDEEIKAGKRLEVS